MFAYFLNLFVAWKIVVIKMFIIKLSQMLTFRPLSLVFILCRTVLLIEFTKIWIETLIMDEIEYELFEYISQSFCEQIVIFLPSCSLIKSVKRINSNILALNSSITNLDIPRLFNAAITWKLRRVIVTPLIHVTFFMHGTLHHNYKITYIYRLNHVNCLHAIWLFWPRPEETYYIHEVTNFSYLLSVWL